MICFENFFVNLFFQISQKDNKRTLQDVFIDSYDCWNIWFVLERKSNFTSILALVELFWNSILFSCIMRGHHGGFMNVLMPGFWFLTLIIGRFFHQVVNWKHGHKLVSFLSFFNFGLASGIPISIFQQKKIWNRGRITL